MKPGTPNFALEKEAEKTVHFVPARSLQESEVCLWENILPFFFQVRVQQARFDQQISSMRASVLKGKAPSLETFCAGERCIPICAAFWSDGAAPPFVTASNKQVFFSTTKSPRATGAAAGPKPPATSLSSFCCESVFFEVSHPSSAAGNFHLCATESSDEDAPSTAPATVATIYLPRETDSSSRLSTSPPTLSLEAVAQHEKLQQCADFEKTRNIEFFFWKQEQQLEEPEILVPLLFEDPKETSPVFVHHEEAGLVGTPGLLLAATSSHRNWKRVCVSFSTMMRYLQKERSFFRWSTPAGAAPHTPATVFAKTKL
jgi:hypothetical protein